MHRRYAVFAAVSGSALSVGACGAQSSPSATRDASMTDVATSTVQDGAAPAMDAGAGSALTCSGWDAAIELEASVSDGAPSVNAEGGAALPGDAPIICSKQGDTHAPIAVVNNSPCAIEMWWVDYSCREQNYGTVSPGGGTWSNNTWETHPWRIRQAGTEVLLLEIPAVAEGGDASLRTITYP